MNGNKKILVIAILLLLISVGFTTYAIYRSSSSVTGNVGLAGWQVEIDGNDIDTSATLTLTLEDFTWTTQTAAVDDKIAPGSVGYVDIPIDATGSEVDVLVTASIDTANMTLPAGMTVSLQSGDDSKTISYSASDMSDSIRINVAWTGTLADTSGKDTTDKAAAGTTVSIPITLTARQATVGS